MSEKFVALFDQHAPFQNDEYLEKTYEIISKVKPQHVIIGGDLFDADGASKWNNEEAHDLLEEYEIANKILENCHKAAPRGAKLIWLLGNHEDNVLQKGRIDRRLRRLCEWGRHMSEAKNWQQVPYSREENKGCYRIGRQVTFIHGHVAPEHAESPSNSLVEQAIINNNAEPFSLVICGHSHRPTELKRMRIAKTPLPHWWMVSGCLCQLNPPRDWMARKRWDLWGNGIVVGDVIPTHSSRKDKYWEVEPIIFEMGRKLNNLREKGLENMASILD